MVLDFSDYFQLKSIDFRLDLLSLKQTNKQTTLYSCWPLLGVRVSLSCPGPRPAVSTVLQVINKDC